MCPNDGATVLEQEALRFYFHFMQNVFILLPSKWHVGPLKRGATNRGGKGFTAQPQ